MANAVERLSLLKVSKRSGGHAMSNKALQESTRFVQEADRWILPGGKQSPEPLLCFPWEGQGRAWQTA